VHTEHPKTKCYKSIDQTVQHKKRFAGQRINQ